MQTDKKIFVAALALCLCTPMTVTAQSVSQTWVSDLGNGQYKNPVLHADYSDPDVCRMPDGSYLLTASSFAGTPGMPILHSRNLVNWRIVNYAVQRLEPEAFFAKAQNGKGIWAPSIRYHEGEYYIYWGDPDFGIYMIKTTDPFGAWSKPTLVKPGKGLIDPCPLWDDGRLYLVHAYAASRAGINSMVVVNELSADGIRVLDDAVMVFDGNDGVNHTIEGPKLYKRNGYYYIFAPAGGVSTGWQLVLRSKSIYGPYEKKIVMKQGSTPVNGPHQGAWVSADGGEDWFLHFQDKGPYGRVLHLNPLQWKNDWPVIGTDRDGDGCGEPVLKWRKPTVNADKNTKINVETPAETDEFDTPKLGLQWEWSGNRQEGFGYNTQIGYMRMYAMNVEADAPNLWEVPSLMLQKFPSDEFTATTKLKFTAKQTGEMAGLIVMGLDYCRLNLRREGDAFVLEQAICKDAEQRNPEMKTTIATFKAEHLVMPGVEDNVWKEIYLRVKVDKNAQCTFAYSEDGLHFKSGGKAFAARQGKWIGAKTGVFCLTPNATGNRGWSDVDWFRLTH